jgi:hypothetical protein
MLVRRAGEYAGIWIEGVQKQVQRFFDGVAKIFRTVVRNLRSGKDYPTIFDFLTPSNTGACVVTFSGNSRYLFLKLLIENVGVANGTRTRNNKLHKLGLYH